MKYHSNYILVIPFTFLFLQTKLYYCSVRYIDDKTNQNISAECFIVATKEGSYIMASANDVAYFFIDLANKDKYGDGMTNLRVNKLLYLAQGHCFARTGEQLFEDDFEAWDYGPVIPSIYQQYKKYGKNPIDEIDNGYRHDIFTSTELDLLVDVAREYGKYATGKLVDFTHCPNSPWSNAFKMGYQLIEKHTIEDYFKSIDTLKTVDALSLVTNLPECGKRDVSGLLLLPSDNDDYYAEYTNDI